MKLYLDDIKDYAFCSRDNTCIRPNILYNDKVITLYETYLKAQNWSMSKYHQGKCACVYFLLNENEVVYIGQTSNEFRIRQHLKNKVFTDVYFIPFRHPYQIKFETMLLSKYKTLYNKKYFNEMKVKSVIEYKMPKYYFTEEMIKQIYLNL
jgi:hypothetical protein